jgi:hypothetical protein
MATGDARVSNTMAGFLVTGLLDRIAALVRAPAAIVEGPVTAAIAVGASMAHSPL